MHGDRRRQSAPWPLTLCAALTMIAACSGGLRAPDPRNELPQGVVDVPAQGATVLRSTFVSGWAIDDSGVRSVRVYIDGKYVTDARTGLERPDVSKAHPRYARGSDAHGWGVQVDFGDLTGAHTLLAQAIDDGGATRDLGSVSVNVKPQ